MKICKSDSNELTEQVITAANAEKNKCVTDNKTA